MTDPLQPTNDSNDSKDDFSRVSVDPERSSPESTEVAFRPETVSAQMKRHRHSLADWLTEADHPERIFWLAVVGYLFGLLILTLLPKGILWLNEGWGFSFDGLLEISYSALTGIKNQWGAVGLIQIVLGWQTRYPERPPLWQASVLAVAYSVVTILIEYVTPGSWQMPLPMAGYMVATTLLTFTIYLFWFRTLSIFACIWLVRRNSVEVTNSLPPEPRGWSIRGLFLVTLLAATLITMFRVGKYVLSMMDGTVTEVNFQWFLIAWWLLELLVTAMIAVVVAWHCIRPNWWMLAGVICAAVGIRSLGLTLAEAVTPPPTGVMISYPSVWEYVFAYLMAFVFHWVCFSLWRKAGFDLIGWMRGRGYRARQGSGVNETGLADT